MSWWLLVPLLAFHSSFRVSTISNPVDGIEHGIASLLLLPVSNLIVAGSKRGSLEVVRVRDDGRVQLCSNSMLDSDVDNVLSQRPFPIFSLACNQTGHLLFCGGGDRYISVWELSGDQKRLRMWKQRLGPHTGWVKDLLYDQRTAILHSIGCNSIESWRLRWHDDHGIGCLSRLRKNSIESSPTRGSTLSSDLLCLCFVGRDCVAAGGVDGRIHVWQSASLRSGDSPWTTISAHQGRVNCLLYLRMTHSRGYLFSGSHDGILKCWGWDNGPGGKYMNLVAALDLGQQLQPDNGMDLRVTALSPLPSFLTDEGRLFLACGTNKGLVLLVVCGRALSNFEEVDLEGSTEFQLSGTIEIGGAPYVHAVCSVPTVSGGDDTPRGILLVGHSHGLSTFRIDFENSVNLVR